MLIHNNEKLEGGVMLSKISLSNFKSFKSLEDLDLRKLTIIAGKNSCGKSSILQSLLLLKQSLGAKDKASLVLDGDYLTYSNLQDVSFGKPQVNHSKIGYTFETLSMKGEKVKYHVEFRNRNINGNYFPRVSELYKLTDDKKIHLNNLPSEDRIRDFISKVLPFKSESGSIEFTVGEIKYDAFIPDSIDVEVSLDKQGLQKFELPYMALKSVSDVYPLIKIKETISNIKYLSPVRATPDRAYVHYSLDADELMHDGSNSAHVLWSKQDEQVFWNNSQMPLIEALSECLDTMGLSQQITPERIGDILYKVSVSDNNSKSNLSLADVGFGYSQILPVILLGLLSDSGSTLLLEQPEIHLHPSSSANLADLFLNLIKDERRIIVETHSPELINRLRLRVIENPELKDDINIVFVEPSNEGATIKQFEIDEDGMFPEWPDGFLDESEKILRAIMEARLNKADDEW